MKGFNRLLLTLAAVIWLFPAYLAAQELRGKSVPNGETVAELISRQVKDRIAEALDPSISQWKIVDLDIPDAGRIPAGFDEFRISSTKSSPRGNRFVLGVEFFKNGKLIKRLNARARLEIYADVVVSKTTIRRGALLVGHMLALEKRPVSLPISDLCTDIAQVEGQITNRRIVSGRTIRKSEISRPPDVRAGKAVMILAENMNVKITTKGIAKEDGAIGDVIPVVNSRSNKRIFARVTGDSTVRVVF